MTVQYLIALAWMTGLLISPEALLVQGNLSGLCGLGFIPLLAAAIILHWTNVTATRHAGVTDPAALVEIKLLTGALGPLSASVLLLMARPALAVCLATALLVTAGFVFNEVFLYWFPNFGFAALLLTIILVLNLAGPRAAAAGQLLFTAAAIAGLAGLAVVGLFNGDRTTPETATALSMTAGARGAGLAAIGFVGYDLLRYNNHRFYPAQLAMVIKTGLVMGGLLLVLWNTAVLFHIAPSRLADTSIPHILAAKAIAGSTGRIIIGIVAIAGACAAVNYLFQTVARMLATMARSHLLPTVFGHSTHRPTRALFTLAVIVGLLMATGFAGTDWLDISIRASLVLWLVFYAVILFAGGRKASQERNPGPALPSSRVTIRPFSIALAMTVIAGMLITTDDDPTALFQAITAILALAVVFAGAGLFLARGIGTKTNTGSPHIRKEKNHDENPTTSDCLPVGSGLNTGRSGCIPGRQRSADDHRRT